MGISTALIAARPLAGQSADGAGSGVAPAGRRRAAHSARIDGDRDGHPVGGRSLAGKSLIRAVVLTAADEGALASVAPEIEGFNANCAQLWATTASVGQSKPSAIWRAKSMSGEATDEPEARVPTREIQ
ncbi:hypothetical protein [Amycolatopsis sp. NPDC051716]|uniref:hypothetical protein n=1 Tax=Amycolatopsis sp. NPDC051716 TaxID=3155804 RepID=UPI0034423FFA